MAEPPRPTIFALSSGRGPAAIAVIRISGSRAGDALKALSGKIPEPRKAALARLRDPRDGDIIDEALALWFPAPNSETGEDTAELQLHGGRAVIAAVLDALGSIEGFRPAEAGEFTRRAFENGKLDLTAVEGLADLVGAETQGQRRQAFRQMKGLLGNRAETWRRRLIQAQALVEARIDFSDEGDVPENLVAPALAITRELADEIAEALADGGRGERLREGLVVAIAGPPNAGKSTLLNRIARREAAIVSPYAGTTRDVIEVHLELGGLPVTLVDTAGIRETDDPVEREGVRRARDRAAAADLVLWVVDAREAEPMAQSAAEPVIPGRPAGSGPESRGPENVSRFRAWTTQVGYSRPERIQMPISGKPEIGGASRIGAVEAFDANAASGTASPPPAWLIRNKIDLIQGLSDSHEAQKLYGGSSERILEPIKPLINMVDGPLTGGSGKTELGVQTNKPLTDMVNERLTRKSESICDSYDYTFDLSNTTGLGFDHLLSQLAVYAETFLSGAESALVTRQRHRFALEDTLAALHRVLNGDLAAHEDLLAEELHIAARALGRLTGRVDVEDILDVIFRDFCIGK
ncbi:MAG: tRNA uridine-5-carboxymethylaminomethyl(34) synthesis GTPase MnmE [Pseudolabrys sp.]